MSEDDEDWFERGVEERADSDAAAGRDEGEDDWFHGGRDDDGASSAGAEPADAGGFDEDFAAAFERAPGPGGAASPATGGEPGGYEEEDFDSAIPRIDLGIEGLDEMVQGGVPERSLIVALGEAGTGKTTFGLQFVNHALENGEPAVFIALEETHDRIIETAEDKGWPFADYVEDGLLAVVDLDPIEMANSLSSIQDELPGLVREFGATRLVLDSVSLLEMMYGNQSTRRNEIFDFTNSLKEAGVTTFLTSEASEHDPYHSRFGIIEYLTDAVFVLRYVRPDDFQETRLAVEIQKIRDANHSRQLKPFEITSEGISVYRQANIF